MSREKYIILVLRSAEPLRGCLEIRILGTKNKVSSDEFAEEVDTLCNIGNMDDWRAIPVKNSTELSLFASYLTAAAKRVEVAADVERQKEINKKQIPLPLLKGK